MASLQSMALFDEISGVQVCITNNFWCAGVHQTIVVKIWESYCTFSEYFCLQNLFPSRVVSGIMGHRVLWKIFQKMKPSSLEVR